MTRRNWILLGLLGVQVLLAAWLLRPAGGGATAASALIPNLKADDITGITVQDSAGSVQLARTAAGWAAPAADNFPVDSVRVTQLISDVLALDTGRLVARTASSHDRLKVADGDYMHRIELTTADGHPQVLLVGTSPNAGAVHVRLGGQDPVYLAPGAVGADARADLSGWIDPAYVAIDPAVVTELDRTTAEGALGLRKESSGQWSLAGSAPGETINQQAVNALLQQAANMSMVKPLGKSARPEYGLDQPTAVITLTVQAAGGASQPTVLTIGKRRDTDGSYVVKSSASDYYVTVAGLSVSDLATKRRSDLVAAAAAPAASALVSATLPVGSTPVTATLPAAAAAPLSPLTTPTPARSQAP